MDIESKRNLLNNFLFNAKEYSVNKLVCSTPNGIFMVDARDAVIGQSILLNGEYEISEVEKWSKLVLPGEDSTLIDIGANIGTSCIPPMLKKIFGQVYAVEPDPNNFEILKYNIDANGLSDLFVANRCAMGSSNCDVDFEISSFNFGDHRVAGVDTDKSRKSIKVSQLTLDFLVDSNRIDLKKVSLIKCDTQGNEGHILEGAVETLQAKIPWLIEFWPAGLKRAGYSKEMFCDIVRSSFSFFMEIGSPSGSLFSNSTSEFSTLFDRYADESYCNVLLLA